MRLTFFNEEVLTSGRRSQFFLQSGSKYLGVVESINRYHKELNSSGESKKDNANESLIIETGKTLVYALNIVILLILFD